MTKFWTSKGKTPKSRDTILQLRDPSTHEPSFTTKSTEMAKIARNYHDGLQDKDKCADPQERQNAIEEMLSHIKPANQDIDMSALSNRLCEEDVDAAIASSKNGKAAGIDGIIYELWKELRKRFSKTQDPHKSNLNITGTLTAVFRDIEGFGLNKDSDFAAGWLCPLYKKGDRTDIANYRPITLLNSDYKLMTKAIALKLAKVAPQIIHNSQAGFVRGRSITDHVRIARLMTDYAEATEENGVIVALDQEKAYDKIDHDYLLKVLRKLNLPENFVKIVQTLYSQADTVVIINGEISDPFRVKRGVRQGDPLSCLLFNLAIEPLSAALRASTLRGWSIPGVHEKLIAILYADDTTVYLREQDSLDTLMTILNKWATAATAKFNVLKTEYIPLGTPEFRNRFCQTRRLNDMSAPIPRETKIASDGTAVRILGGWVGNLIDDATPWSPILDRTVATLKRWSNLFPSTTGKCMIANMIIGGMSQYLTAADGMPREILKKLEKLTTDFFWDWKKTHTINKHTLHLPSRAGGKDLLDIEARNESIYLVWTKKLYADESERPLWAYIALEIIRRSINSKYKTRVRHTERTDPLTQSWNASKRKLPNELKHIETVSKKYGLTIDSPLPSLDVRLKMPIWHHFASYSKSGQNSHTANCLKTTHAVHTVEDLYEIADPGDDHEDNNTCPCEDCEADRDEGCNKPFQCQNLARNMLACLPPKWHPETEQMPDDLDLDDTQRAANLVTKKNRRIYLFDPAIQSGDRRSENVRIFTNSFAVSNPRDNTTLAQDLPGTREYNEPEMKDTTVAYTISKVDRGHHDEQISALSVVFEDTWEAIGETACTPSGVNSELATASLAILIAAARAPPQTHHYGYEAPTAAQS